MNMALRNNDNSPKIFLSVDEAARCLGVGRTILYELMNAHEFRSVKIGGKRLIDFRSLQSYADSLGEGV